MGYHIHYTNLDPEGYGEVSTGSHPTGPTNSSTLIKSLLKFTSYRIQVSAFTVKGDGPLSDAVIVPTEEDGKKQCLVDIMYLLTEWEGRTGKYLARGQDVLTERRDNASTSSQAEFILEMKQRSKKIKIY